MNKPSHLLLSIPFTENCVFSQPSLITVSPKSGQIGVTMLLLCKNHRLRISHDSITIRPSDFYRVLTIVVLCATFNYPPIAPFPRAVLPYVLLIIKLSASFFRLFASSLQKKSARNESDFQMKRNWGSIDVGMVTRHTGEIAFSV